MATQDRLPTSDGIISAWNANNFGSKWSAVDDAVGSPDEDSTYISSSGTTQRTQMLGFSAFSISASTIAKVKITLRVKHVTAGGNIRAGLMISSVTYYPSNQSTTTSYVNKTYEWTVNPSTGLAWTESEIETLSQFTIQGSGSASNSQLRVTQAYITVEYTDAGGNNYTLTAGQGSFTLAGNSADLLAGRKISAAQGSFLLTGNAANLAAAGDTTYLTEENGDRLTDDDGNKFIEE